MWKIFVVIISKLRVAVSENKEVLPALPQWSSQLCYAPWCLHCAVLPDWGCQTQRRCTHSSWVPSHPSWSRWSSPVAALEDIDFLKGTSVETVQSMALPWQKAPLEDRCPAHCLEYQHARGAVQAVLHIPACHSACTRLGGSRPQIFHYCNKTKRYYY